MPYTEEQLERFRTAFARRRRNQLLLAIPIILIVLFVSAKSDRNSSSLAGIPAQYLGVAGIVLALCALAFTLYNWRCPACNRYLGRVIFPRFCTKCGVPLS